MGVLGLQEVIGAGVDTDAALDALALVKDGGTEMPFFKAMAHCLQYSTQVPHPVQSPEVRSGLILLMTPISFKSGLLHM
ncbi:MAG: hypothetical protein PHI67_05025 [Candidatus Methanomethylophilaceae archaeon]|nr:hypothetical protein [Candidatus Methanomethylophilaceae archaeon]